MTMLEGLVSSWCAIMGLGWIAGADGGLYAFDRAACRVGGEVRPGQRVRFLPAVGRFRRARRVELVAEEASNAG